MRIAVLCSDPEVRFGDGHACPERMRGLSRAMARAGHEVIVICAGVEAGQGEIEGGLTVRTLRMPVSVREIDWHCSHVKPDLVLEWYVPGSLEGVRAAAEAGVPHVYDVGLDTPPRGVVTSPAVRGAIPEALALSRGALAPSERVADWLRGLAGHGCPVAVVPNGTDVGLLTATAPEASARIERRLKLRPEPVRVGFLGALEPGSGLLTLVRALGRFGAERRPRPLVMGDGPERNAALVVAGQEQVGLVLTGRVAAREIAAHLALCDVVVVPGDEESGAPQALLDAMAASRAVIVPETSQMQELARHGQDAWLVRPGDVDSLAFALEALMEDPGRRARLGANAQRAARTAHTWDTRALRVTSFAEQQIPIEQPRAQLSELR